MDDLKKGPSTKLTNKITNPFELVAIKQNPGPSNLERLPESEKDFSIEQLYFSSKKDEKDRKRQNVGTTKSITSSKSIKIEKTRATPSKLSRTKYSDHDDVVLKKLVLKYHRSYSGPNINSMKLFNNIREHIERTKCMSTGHSALSLRSRYTQKLLPKILEEMPIKSKTNFVELFEESSDENAENNNDETSDEIDDEAVNTEEKAIVAENTQVNPSVEENSQEYEILDLSVGGKSNSSASRLPDEQSDNFPSLAINLRPSEIVLENKVDILPVVDCTIRAASSPNKHSVAGNSGDVLSDDITVRDANVTPFAPLAVGVSLEDNTTADEIFRSISLGQNDFSHYTRDLTFELIKLVAENLHTLLSDEDKVPNAALLEGDIQRKIAIFFAQRRSTSNEVESMATLGVRLSMFAQSLIRDENSSSDDD